MAFLRCKTDADIKMLSLLAKEIYTEHYSTLLNFDDLNYWINLYQSEMSIKTAIEIGEEYYLVKIENAFIGYFSFRIDMKNKQMFLSKLYLKKSLRGLGVGKAVMLYIFDVAKKYNLNEIQLKTMRKNPSVEFYKKFGFQINGEIKTDLGNGLILKDFLMVKII